MTSTSTETQRLNRHDAASLQPAIAELERLYDGALPRVLAAANLREAARPTLVIQRAGRRTVFGWMQAQVWTCGPGQRNEITLAAESLNRGGLPAFATLVHEMVHHANQLRGVRDVSPVGQYHNRSFRDLAQAVGLTVEKVAHRGFAQTALGPDLLTLAEALGPDESAFSLFRVPPSERRPGSRLKKWQCACPRIFRAAVEHRALCLDCQTEYRRTDSD